MVLDLFSFPPAALSPPRPTPAAAPRQTQLPSRRARLWWALPAMAPPAPKTQASPAADRTPRLPSASSPLSPPKEPPTRLGAAPPTLRTLPTPAGAAESPSETPRGGELPGKKKPKVSKRELGIIGLIGSLRIQPTHPCPQGIYSVARNLTAIRSLFGGSVEGLWVLMPGAVGFGHTKLHSANRCTFPPAPLQPPSSPGGQRTATKIPSPAAISPPLRPPRPPLPPSAPPLQPPLPPPPLPPRCLHPLRRPPLPPPLTFAVPTQTTQRITKAGIATNAMLPTRPAGQLGMSLPGPLLPKILLSASRHPTPPTCPPSPTGLLTRTTGLLRLKLRPQSLQNLVEEGAAGGPALREKKLEPPHAQHHRPVQVPQPQRPPTRACPSLSTAAWIPALRCC